MVELVIKNCKVVKPDGILDAGIAVENGRIVQISPDSFLPEAREEYDAEGNYVIPGVIDPHVHISWPDWDFKEDTVATTKAAAAGGVTTIMHYLNEPGSLQKAFLTKKQICEENSLVDFAYHAGIYSEDQIDEIPSFSKNGICSFKFYIPYRGAEAVPPLVGIDDGIVYLGFEAISKLGFPGMAMVHAENIEVFFKLKDRIIKNGLADKVDWTDTRPNFSEAEAIRRSAYLAKITDCPLYVVHMSTAEGVEEILRARDEGVTVIAETCPQYLLLNRKADRILGKVNPPLRDEKDNQALWEAVQKGIIDCLGTDHASCARRHKTEFWSAVVGMAGIQLFLPLMLSEGVNKQRLTLNQLVRLTSYNIAQIFGLPNKGRIEVGADADLVIVDLNRKYTVRAKELHHISDFTPYEDWELTGMPVLTAVRGQVVMRDLKVVGTPGIGRYVPAKANA